MQSRIAQTKECRKYLKGSLLLDSLTKNIKKAKLGNIFENFEKNQFRKLKLGTLHALVLPKMKTLKNIEGKNFAQCRKKH